MKRFKDVHGARVLQGMRPHGLGSLDFLCICRPWNRVPQGKIPLRSRLRRWERTSVGDRHLQGAQLLRSVARVTLAQFDRAYGGVLRQEMRDLGHGNGLREMKLHANSVVRL